MAEPVAPPSTMVVGNEVGIDSLAQIFQHSRMLLASVLCPQK